MNDQPERQLQVAFRGVRIPVYDKETRKAHEMKMPIAVEVLFPPGKFTPEPEKVTKCIRKGHRPANEKNMCSRCGSVL